MGVHVAHEKQQTRSEEGRQCGTDHACTEHTGCETFTCGRVPSGAERNTNREHGTGNTEQEREDQHQGEGLHRTGKTDQKHQRGAHSKHQAHHDAPAVLIGQTTDRDTPDCTNKDRHGNQQTGGARV